MSEADLKQNSNEKADKHKISSNKSLDQIKFWKDRLIFGKNQFFLWLVILISEIGMHYYLYNITNQEFNYFNKIGDVLSIFALLYALYIMKLIKGPFENMIVNNKMIFQSEENFQEYFDYICEKYNSKIEKYIPILFYAIWFIWTFVVWDVFGRLFLNTLDKNPIPSNLYFLSIIQMISEIIIWVPVFLIVGSMVILLIITFGCINKLGSKEFPLNINYEELEIGIFDKIGKYIISLSIPAIVLSTGFSIFGLINIFAIKNILGGYLYLFISLAITIILAFLLYRNTINIHSAIVNFKLKLKKNLIREIKDLQRDQNYQKIQYIHDFYDRVDNISDWPYNPKSIKKLSITFFSSVFPLILSLFGI